MSGPDRAAWQALLADEERRLGLAQGFKMLYGPWAGLGTARVAFLSLKPGAAPPGAEARVVSDERGNSYEVERETTVSPITEQFLALAELIGTAPQDILTGVASPFRAAAWEDLTPAQKEGGLALGRRFWRTPLSRPGMRLVVAVSQEAADLVVSLTGATMDAEIPAEWGTLSLRRYRTPDGRVIVHLPHLSRFRLLSRAASREAVAQILGLAAHEPPSRKSYGVRRSAQVVADEPTKLDAAFADLPKEASEVFAAIQRSRDYDCAALTMQLTVSYRGQKVGGLNRRLMEWHVSKVFVGAFNGPEPLERRGFRVIETDRGHRYWALKGAAGGAAFAAAIGEMTGVPI